MDGVKQLFDDDKVLNLGKTYTYTVSVRDMDKLFAGKLSLSPDRCTLRVMGERRPSYDFSQSTKIECSAFDMNFLLFELSNHYQSSQSLQSTVDEQVGFFEYEFEVGFVVCFEGHCHSFDDAIGFCVKSEMTKNWVGYTELQQELVEKFHTRTLNPISDSLEFNQILKGYGQLRLFYHFQTHHNVHEFSSGLNFPPKLSIQFDSLVSISDLHFEYKKFYHLMTLLIGSDFKVNEVTVTSGSQTFSSNTSVYFPTTHRTHERDYPVFPLGLNLRFNDQGLPDFPLEAFSNYYLLEEKERIIFTRYLRYQRMKSDEEKFLGFFRLLESLTTKSSSYVEPESLEVFLKESKACILEKLKDRGTNKDIKKLISRIGRLNTMKYNTSKCIEDFLKKLPEDIRRSMVVTDEDVQDIINLRNNITHANAYTINDRELEKYTSFINVLLYLALLERIGIHPEVGSKVVYRLDGYHHIQNHNY
ncbi:HEPN domain-containing protein [Shewanella sp.]|uniref:ApeA N-terminal domain 1-containing protein n=1 Tax=Shewanella sp. TaxID=50422 RepID=UPI001ECDB330|nr:HEPN domain-containing protein [Shewanella sp.]NRB24069.1 hypothetical protein [Shewanella sp.]